MQEVFEKIIEKLEIQKDYYKTIRKNTYCRRTEMDDCDSCRADHYLEARLSAIDDAIEIVKQEAERYEECYKDCGDCEAYNKEKHYCPKFCKVIKETVKEIEENHNGWIPCSEWLPEEHKQYDITTKNDVGIHSDTAIYNPFLGMWFWDEAESKHIEIEVLAWAEKREPYQPKGE